jgi:GNAT superfamily N-acetyltransferase
VTNRYEPPELLAGRHDLSGLQCRSSEQTDWLLRYGLQSAATGSTRVFVVTERDSDLVVAYYAWCMAQVQTSSAPDRMRKGAGRYPQPVALLARLGVDVDHEGKGLGAALLQDVFARLVELSADIGCRGLLVHAESAEARAFYLHLVPEFEPSPTDELHLVLLMKDIRRTLLGSTAPTRAGPGR